MHVVYSFPHALGGPGIGTTAWHQVCALSRADARVTVVCTSVAKALPADVRVQVVSSLRSVRHRMLGMNRAYGWHDYVASRVVRRSRPEVVHCWPRSVLRTAAAARSVGALTVREAPSPYTRVAVASALEGWAEMGMTPPPGHFHRLSEGDLAREDQEFLTVDLVTVGSSAAAATFADLGVCTAVVPYGYEPRLFQPSSRTALSPPTAVFVGRCEPGKGVHVLLQAWRDAQVASGQLLLCGDMPREVRERLVGLLSCPGVVELGRVTQVPEVLARADVLVLPSFSEGSALVVYEALGAGVVPLVSRAAGAPVRDGVEGLVHETGDVTGLTAHLLQMLASPEDLLRLRSGVLAVRGRWSWDATGPRLLLAYEQRLRELGGG